MNYQQIVDEQKQFFYTGTTLPLSYRLEALSKLKNAIKQHEDEIFDALKKDLNKSKEEAFSTEIGFLYEEINFIKKRLHRWMKPEKVANSLLTTMAKSRIYYEPYGVSLIIAPWNYPLQLAIAPLIGAISSGCTAILKPSELTPNVSKVIKSIIESAFPKEYITVIEGGVAETEELLAIRFDKIFFTGSVPVGKIVMKAASEYVTPLTLELGGKSPCIIDKDAKLDLAVKRVAFGKFINAGQTCIAPDYLLIHSSIKEEFIEKLRNTVEKFYGNDALQNDDYTRIVSERHFARLVSFIENEKVLMGGESSVETLQIQPTLLDKPDLDSPVMNEEIFGPVLPVYTFEELPEVIPFIRRYEKPLALYYFGETNESQQYILEKLTFGGGTINDTLYHLLNPNLPFGGVGESGTGGYHGHSSFLSFSHQKSVLKATTSFDLSLRYPGAKNALKWMRKIMK